MIVSITLAASIFVALLAGMELGRWLRRRRAATVDVGSENASADGAVFAILGLLIAFSFSSSAGRFDERRRLITTQANAIGTAWTRIDLLAEPDREPMHRYLRDWVKLAIDLMPRADEMEPAEFQAQLSKAQQIQNDAWRYAVAAVDRQPKTHVALLVLAPLNEWIDLTSERLELNNRDAPPMVLPTLFLLAIVGSVLAGFNMGKSTPRSPLHILAFAGSLAFCLYVMMDMNHPRSGLIRIDAADHAMKQLYASMLSPAASPAATEAK